LLPEAESLLYDALAAARNAIDFAKGRTLEEYVADTLLRAAVERMMFILGEAISQLRTKDPSAFDQLTDASKIVGLRNLLAHGYNRVDDARLWRTLREALPVTVAEIERLLPDSP
jgi:uncharacterized protein with HEPN domain